MNQPKRTRKELRGAIIGMVMGDGCLCQNPFRDGSKRGNYKLDINHSVRQEDYLKHKKDVVNVLFDYEIPITNKRVHLKETGKTYFQKRMQTRVHPRFKFIANQIYIDGKKRITPWVLDNITIEGLSYWWMDDGCLHIRKSAKGFQVIWGTYGFLKEDVERFREWLIDKYDIHLNLNKHCKSGWYLKRGSYEACKLCDLLKPYSIPSMNYKFDYEKSFYKNRNHDLFSNSNNSACYPVLTG